MARRLLLEQLVDAAVFRIIGCGIVPFRQKSIALRRSEQRQLVDAARRIGDDSFQQPDEMACHPLDRGDVEQVARVLEVAFQLAVALGQAHGQVELRGAGVDPRDPAHVEAGQFPMSGRGVLERERSLEQRVARQVALWRQLLDQFLEWQVLMRIGVQRPFPNAPQVLRERGAARQVAAQHERVHEKPDQPLQLRAGATGRRHADRDVLLPAVAIEQDLEGGEQGHEQRRPFAPTERLQRSGQRFRRFEIDGAAAIARLWGAWSIRGQVECRQRRQRLPPISQLLFDRRALEPLPLPHREVGVLDRQRRQR